MARPRGGGCVTQWSRAASCEVILVHAALLPAFLARSTPILWHVYRVSQREQTNHLTAAATECFERIGSATIQRVRGEYAVRRKQVCLRFSGKSIRVFDGSSSGKDMEIRLCMPVERETAATSDGDKLIAGKFYRPSVGTSYRRPSLRRARNRRMDGGGMNTG
jgi:hypothetical protein